MPRYRLTVEFDGGEYVGWQRQDNGASVQGALERAAEAFSGQPAPVAGAGRTDSGVHALAMTAHVDLGKVFEPRVVRDAMNAHLRDERIVVRCVDDAPDDFHARFSCIGRRYLYRILDRRAPPALDRGKVWHVPFPLDHAAMAHSAQALIGRHDFTTFRSAHCQASSPLRTMDQVEVWREGEEIHLTLAARSFLHNQVRSIAGSLERVGAGKWPTARIGEVLEACDRTACGPVAPAHGLYFAEAVYR